MIQSQSEYHLYVLRAFGIGRHSDGSPYSTGRLLVYDRRRHTIADIRMTPSGQVLIQAYVEVEEPRLLKSLAVVPEADFQTIAQRKIYRIIQTGGVSEYGKFYRNADCSGVDSLWMFVFGERTPTKIEVPAVPLWEVEIPPKPKHIPKPKYPKIAKQAGIEGRVIIHALIDVDGTVREAKVKKSSGDALLDTAAVDAARKALFTPARQKDRFVRVWFAIPFNFTLER